MSENTIDLDFGTTAQKQQDGEKLPVVLLALDQGKYDMARSLDELRALADANGMEAVAEVTQKRSTPEAATLLGEGKVAEARLVCQNLNAAAAIFDGELTGSQIRNLSAALQVEVLDRTMLILEIFRARATTNEGKLQTELATLRYQLPRLQGLGCIPSAARAAAAAAGAAVVPAAVPVKPSWSWTAATCTTALNISKAVLKRWRSARGETRRARQKNNVPVVALVGYTNVGKSSLLNALCGEQIFEADMLFATLDPTARKLPLPSGLQIILVDTVGFVSRLPHHLVEAFKSTLEEAAYADVIVKVADAGDDQAAEQLAVTDEVLSSLDCEGIPQLVVYNKCDTANLLSFDPDILLTSAKTGVGLPALLAKIDDVLAHRVRGIEVLLPYDKLALADILRSRGSVAEEEYREDGVYYRATVKIDDLHRFEPYLV